jgi:hypothetical protein
MFKKSSNKKTLISVSILTVLLIGGSLFLYLRSVSIDETNAAVVTAQYTLGLFIATFALVVATIALAGIAWIQISAGQTQTRKWATLKICDRWDTDAFLREANETLKSAFSEANDGRIATRHAKCLITIYNYFDSIAIGIDQGFYEKEIVIPHMGNIMRQGMRRRSQWPLEFDIEFENDFRVFFKFFKDHVEFAT